MGDKSGELVERDEVMNSLCAPLRRLYLVLKSTGANKRLHTMK